MASIPRRFEPDLAVDLASILLQKHHDWAMIGPRSGVDRGPGSPSIVVGSSRSDSAVRDVRSRLNRVAIAVFFHALSAPSDGALQVKWMVLITRHCGRQITIARIKIARSVRRQMGEDRDDDGDRDAIRSMTIQRSSIVHVSRGKPSILIHLLSFFSTCCNH